MTREEAREWLLQIKDRIRGGDEEFDARRHEALDMAIEALERYGPKEGYWENRESVQVDEDGYDVATCSICGSEITLEYPYDNYCPNCGTWMHGKVEWK